MVTLSSTILSAAIWHYNSDQNLCCEIKLFKFAAECTSAMDARGSYWYLEHVSTGKKLILQSGDNSVGRHSCCKIVLKEYDFLSRQHAKFIVNSENISVEQLVSVLFH